MLRRTLCRGALQATATTTAAQLEELETRGVTIVPQAFAAADLAVLQAEYDKLATLLETVTTTSPPKLRRYEEDGKEVRSNYWVHKHNHVLECGPGRRDSNVGFNAGPLASPMFLGNPRVTALVKPTLQHGPFATRAGMLLSAAGSGDQYWHRDVDPLFHNDANRAKLVTLMDDFYVTVLIPLVALSEANGTPEFMLRTHRADATAYETATRARFDVARGDAVVFNGKINHRGRGNPSPHARPVLYIVYHKPWYNDAYRAGVPESMGVFPDDAAEA